MKFLFISDSIRENMTGVGKYNYSLIKSILRFNHNIEYQFVDYIRNRFNKDKLILFNNSLLVKKKSIWYNYIAIKLRKYNFDYIFNLTGTPHLLKFSHKEVLVIHDLHPILHPDFADTKTVIYNKLFLGLTIKNADKIIVNSDQTKTELIKYFNVDEKKIFKIFIPPLIRECENVKNKYLIRLTQKPFILYIGNIDLRKNIINLIKAFLVIKKIKKFYNYKLILVGKAGFQYEAINNFLKTINNNKEDIVFTGYLPDLHKYYLLSKASVFIYIPFYEGLGIPVYEAAYFKKPIISSDIPIVNEFFKNTTLVINPDRIDNIADALTTTLNGYYSAKWINYNKEIAIELSKNNRMKREIKKLISFLKN